MTKLERLHPGEYLHPFDAKALQALQSTNGLNTLIKKLYEWGLEKYLRQQYLGQSLKLSATNFPDVWGVFEAACDTLDFKEKPQLYVMRELGMECFTCGVTNTMIILGTECIEKLSEEELLFALGREIGHIQCQHVSYMEVGAMLPVLADALSAATLGMGGLLSAGIQFALVEWIQTAEYSADRAGLLACQSMEVAASALVKVAGLPLQYDPAIILDDFKTQAIEFEDINRATFMRFTKYLTQSKAWEVARAQQLFKWAESGDYKAVLERKTQAPAPPKINFCPSCGYKLTMAGKFCPGCGGVLPA